MNFENAKRGRCVVCGDVVSKPAFAVKLTCSSHCHEVFVSQMEQEFGKYKKIVRMRTGGEFRVPTRDIIEVGVREEELDKYPKWD